jgi:transcriptional regulator with XRE-family HTH domain
MSGYNIFNNAIPAELKDSYNEEYAQTEALLNAANLISEAIEQRNINQTELAELLGVSRGYVSRLLSGNENMSIKNVAKVLHVLGKRYIQTIADIPRETNGKVVYFKEYSNIKIDKEDIKCVIRTNATGSKWMGAVING